MVMTDYLTDKVTCNFCFATLVGRISYYSNWASSTEYVKNVKIKPNKIVKLNSVSQLRG